MNEPARLDLLRTLRGRRPVFRATFALPRWMARPTVRFACAVGVGFCVIGFGVTEVLGLERSGDLFLLLPLAMILPLWLVPLPDLLVGCDPFGRRLLHRWEKLAAPFTGGALLVALSFLAAWYRAGTEVSAWLAAGFAFFGTCGSLLRGVRSRAAAWRAGTGAALIAAALVGSWIAARRWMLALPSVTAGGRRGAGR